MGPLMSLDLPASVAFSVTFGLWVVMLDAFVDGFEVFIGADSRDHHESPSNIFVGRIFFMEASRADDTVVVVLVVSSVDKETSGISENGGGDISSFVGVVDDVL